MVRRPLTICAVGPSTSSHVVSRVRCFAERGHRVFLICEVRTGIDGVTELVPSEALGERVPIVRVLNATSLRLRGRPLRGVSLLSLLLSFPELVRQCRPDVVHVHYAYSVWAWMATVANHHPLVVSVMGGDILFDEQGSPTPRGRRLTLQLLESADLITSKSEYLIETLDRLGDFGSKAMKVVWGVDLRRFRRVPADGLRATLGLAERDLVILSPKILQRFYNVHLLVEAMPRITAAIPQARLLITEYAADKDYKADIVQRVQTLGLEQHVRFVGHVPHSDMPLYYSLADVTVAVPSSDGLPQTLFEGMACESPSILSRLPRYEEVVAHGESAYFVEIAPESIADGVIRLLGDRVLHERIARTGRQLVAAHADFERDVARMEEKYYELVGASRHRRRTYFRRAKVLGEIVRYWTQA
jgi:glycosyltransferase involved in cell wall biosynthesis